MPLDRVLCLEHLTYGVTHGGAIIDRDANLVVDVNAQQRMPAVRIDLDTPQLTAESRNHWRQQNLQIVRPCRHENLPRQKQKMGAWPTFRCVGHVARHRLLCQSARPTAGDAPKKKPHEGAFLYSGTGTAINAQPNRNSDLVAGAGFEPTTFGL